MDATTASLIGTGIGALAGLAGGWLNGLRQSKIEHEKWIRSRHDTLEKETRLALADLTKKLAGVVHAISWLTWKSANEPENVSESDLSAYDATIQSLFPDIVGSRVILAALSQETHEQISPLIQDLYAFDLRIGRASALYKNSTSEGIKALASCHDDSMHFDERLLHEVTKIGISRMVTAKKDQI